MNWRNHPFHNSWQCMKKRCRPEDKLAQYYYERGISYCLDWEFFTNFYRDMWGTWQDGLVLDRKDNDKGYSKDNCRWATRQQNSRNRTNSRLTEQQFVEVYRLIDSGHKNVEVAVLFGVDPNIIGGALRSRRAKQQT